MRPAFSLSVALHGAILLIVLFGLPRPDQTDLMIPEPVPVEIVTIGEVTNTKLEEPDLPKPAPPVPPPPQSQEPPPPAPQPEPEPPPPEPSAPQPPAPEPPKPEPPEPKPEFKKLAELPKVEETKPVVLEKPKPVPEPKKPEPKSFDSLLKDVAKLKEKTPPSDEKKPPTPQPPQPASVQTSRSDKLTITEEDALRRQLTQCWNVDPGAKGVHEVRAEIRVYFDGQLRVQRTDFVRGSGSMSDPYFRSFVESALRAPLKPLCSTLQLPPDKYGSAQSIIVNFSPKDMF